MGHYARIDERAFNRGVEQVLRLGPLTRAVREVISGKGKPTVDSGLHSHQARSKTIIVHTPRSGRKQK